MAYTYSIADADPTADVRLMLEAYLDHHRAAMVAKVQGVSDVDARRRQVPSETTLLGLVQHLRRVEASWFEHRLAQGNVEDIPLLAWFFEDPEHRDFWVAPDLTVEEAIAAYQDQCERSRAVAGRHELDDVVPHPELGSISMRWIMLHMIEETARHLGHADILREQLDGQTGGWHVPFSEPTGHSGETGRYREGWVLGRRVGQRGRDGLVGELGAGRGRPAASTHGPAAETGRVSPRVRWRSIRAR